MRLYKILIIEDEPRAARQLIEMLKKTNIEHELIGQPDSIEDSVTILKREKEIDLVFMDIQLADGLSFEIFGQVDISCPIIFTTAFDQYAIRAFKHNSVDYLLKPIQWEELNYALEQFLDRGSRPKVDEKLLTNLLRSIQEPQHRNNILVKDGTTFLPVQISDIQYFYSEESVSFAVTDDKRFIIDESMEKLMNEVDKKLFFRINRGQIVNRNAISKINPYHNQRLKLSIKNSRDLEFIVSRAKLNPFKEWMNQ